MGIFVASAFLFAGGFLVSGVLALESFCMGSNQQKVISPLYGADLAGGCAGSVAGSLFFIPFLGMMFTAALMIFLSFAAILCARRA
jgi:hypothetical protein